MSYNNKEVLITTGMIYFSKFRDINSRSFSMVTVQYHAPGHAGLCQNQVTLKCRVPPVSGVDGKGTS
jgi:hypothetical protein